MDRRRETRVQVNLSAVVMNDKVLPVGCRVENVSSTGMLLRHEGSEDQAKIKTEDKVEVRISLKQNDERKVIQLPITVVRQSENYLGGQFPQPQPELMTLVEPYRTSDPDAVIPFLSISANQQLELPTDPEPTSLETAEPVAIAIESQSGIEASIPIKNAATESNRSSHLLSIGVICLVFLLIGLNIFLLQEVRTLTSRIAILESQSENSPTELQRPVQVDEKVFNDHLASFLHQNTAIESRLISLESSTKLATASAATRPIEIVSDTLLQKEISLSERSSTGAPSIDTSLTKAENWVINLLSLHNERAALEFSQRARAAGIAVNVRPEVENQDQVWRVQIGGFSSRVEAGSFSLQAQETLGLTSVWIFRDSN